MSSRPPIKVRGLLALGTLLTRVGLAPTLEQSMRTPVAERRAMGPAAAMVGDVPEVATVDHDVTTRDGATIRVRVYRPPVTTTSVLYAHGGGFVGGGIVSCDHICRRIAVEADAVVVSVEYRLAPECPFPTPLDECEDALRWMLSDSDLPDRLVVAGDSAGGNLVAALAIRLRGREPALAGQVLIYPTVDLTGTGEGLLGYRGIGLTTKDCLVIAKAYLAGADPLQPEASPLHAADLSGLPPAFVLTVEHDPLRDEGAAYAQRLQDAGVPCTYVDIPRHVHGSLSIPALYQGIDDVHRQIADAVRAVPR
jgi:acetyl esterase